MGSYKDILTGTLRCSFCGKGKSEVARLVAGPQVYICNECINICIEIVIMDAQQNFSSLPDALPSLSEVSEALLQSERYQLLHEGLKSSPKHL